jgi:hypothetical protein
MRRYGFYSSAYPLMPIIVLSIGASIAGPTRSWADVSFRYEQQSPVFLGASIDIRNPTETKRNCLVSLDADWIEAGAGVGGSLGGVTRISVSGQYTDDYREIFKQLNVNAFFKGSMSVAKIGSFGGEGKLDLDYSFSGNYADLAYILTADYDFGQRRLKGAQLAPQYAKLIEEKKFDEFIAQCGTHYAVSERRASSASIVINISNLSESIKRRLKASYSGSAKLVTNAADISAGLSVEAQYNTAQKYGRATLDFRAVGGDSTKAASLAAATQSNDINAALTAMQTYMTGIDRNTAVPVQYELVSFELFGLQYQTNPEQQRFVEIGYLSGVKYQSQINAIRERLKQVMDAPQGGALLAEIYKGDLFRIQAQKAVLDTLMKECLQSRTCNISELNSKTPDIAWASSTFYDLQPSYVCLYNADVLGSISVRLFGRALDATFVQDFRVYRIRDFSPNVQTRTDVVRTNLADESADRRFVSRIDVLQPTTVGGSGINGVQFVDEARATRYELQLVLNGGRQEWYDLGYASIPSDRCPAIKH